MSKLKPLPLHLLLLLSACAAGTARGDDDSGRRNNDAGRDASRRDTDDGDVDELFDADADAATDDVGEPDDDGSADTDATNDAASDATADADAVATDIEVDTDIADDSGADTLLDTADTSPVDASDDVSADVAADALVDTSPDAAPDAAADVAADVLVDAPTDAATDTAVDVTEPSDVFDADPTRPPARGSYVYSRLPVGGLKQIALVDVHPENTFALVAENYDIVRIYDVATGTFIGPVDVGPTTASSYFYFEDLDWSPDGTYGLLTGRIVNGSNESGSIIRIDVATLRAATDATSALAAFETLAPPASSSYAAVEWPLSGNLPVVLSRTKSSGNYSFALRRYNDDTRAFTLIGAQPSSAGCQDIAFADNEFGEPGIFIVCGENGYDGWYYTEIGGVGEWRNGLSSLGNNNLGNSSSIAGHPTGMFALIVSWSGRALYRFEDGRLNGYSAAPRFSTLPIYSIAFAPDGLRALILGQMSVSNNGVVLEYRYDAYACASLGTAGCGITDVSIPNFNLAPWIAPSYTLLGDADWRTDCDGGLIAGGYTNFSTNYGVIGTFQLEGGRDCGW